MKTHLNIPVALLTAVVVKGLFTGFNLPMALLGTALVSLMGYASHITLRKEEELSKNYIKHLTELEERLKDKISSLEGKVNATGLVRRM